MRSDKQKLQAQQKAGGKRERKDVENRRQPKAASKQGHEAKESGDALTRRRDQKGPTLH